MPTKTTYNLSNINLFMKNMHNVFLYGKIEPVKLIVAKSSNNTNDNDKKTPPYFLDFAFKLLKLIKIHAKFIFNIEIAKTNAERVPTIKIESLKKEETQDSLTNSYDITNPDNVEISLKEGQYDSYIINEIVDFENSTPQIQIIHPDLKNKDSNRFFIITKHGTHKANEDGKNNDYKYHDYFIADMKSLLNKNYKTNDGFSVNIYLEYTKKNANTILIKKINIHTTKNSLATQ
jgi:hypothetical protein